MNEPGRAQFEQLNDDDREALRRHSRLAGQISEWLKPFGFLKDTNTQIVMRLTAGEQDGNLLRDVTTGALIAGDQIIEAIKAGHAISLEAFTHSGRFVSSCITRQTAPGQIDFNFFGFLDLIDSY